MNNWTQIGMIPSIRKIFHSSGEFWKGPKGNLILINPTSVTSFVTRSTFLSKRTQCFHRKTTTTTTTTTTTHLRLCTFDWPGPGKMSISLSKEVEEKRPSAACNAPVGKYVLKGFGYETQLHPRRLTWNLQIKENDLANLHDYVPC